MLILATSFYLCKQFAFETILSFSTFVAKGGPALVQFSLEGC